MELSVRLEICPDWLHYDRERNKPSTVSEPSAVKPVHLEAVEGKEDLD